MIPPNSDAPTAAKEVIVNVVAEYTDQAVGEVMSHYAAKDILDALAAAFPHLCWDVTDQEQLKLALVAAGWRQQNLDADGTHHDSRVWLVPERETVCASGICARPLGHAGEHKAGDWLAPEREG